MNYYYMHLSLTVSLALPVSANFNTNYVINCYIVFGFNVVIHKPFQEIMLIARGPNFKQAEGGSTEYQPGEGGGA